MANWKDFLYFPKNDRVAIILLLTLICIGGGISIYLNNFDEAPESHITRTEKTQKEFKQFEENMSRIPLISDNNSTEATEIKDANKKVKKSSSPKLESGQIIDINSASTTTLTRIPGIGNTFAERIIEYRTALGGFYSLEQLQEIKGITNNKFSQILPYLVIKKGRQPIDINRTGTEKLVLHPYLNDKQIEIILTTRQRSKINSWDDLSDHGNFTPRDIERLSPYIMFK